ncbi:tyrosine-type recombinase/integrase [Roseospira marina]|uniref:Tyrosine-type recombinase/integrase n=2 Tax=Roseospira marina TaxID=140057 RepID=A0A5M6IFJ0_9PROT|nr:tyrosine-type recombinase/integrase [Roseospira marina]KAA5606348.1 tyrosine-type recombinase/integrase [Roseospira marina]MBB4314254.1 integrase [Roseospira marina]
MKGINTVRAKGRTYYYHRATKQRIHAAPGTAAFAAEVARIEQEAADATVKPEGTWGWLVESYRKSPEWAGLAGRTRKDYQRVFDYLSKMDRVPLAHITTEGILQVRDKAHEQHGRRLANYCLSVVSLVWNWGRPRGKTKTANPTDGVPKIARPKHMEAANRPWTEAELQAVLTAASPHIRAAIALAAYTGLRESDVLRWPWSGYDGSAIEGRDAKTSGQVWMPAHRDLRAVLDTLPRTGPVIVCSRNGTPYTQNGFLSSWRKLRTRLEAEGKVGPGLTIHGLRHTVATKLADAGADTRTIMAITGHATEAMVKRYTERADRRKRATAAMKLLERDQD